jgi:hypothetical protein
MAKKKPEAPVDVSDPAADLLDQVEIETEEESAVDESEKVIPESEGTPEEPAIHDPLWTQFVLSQLTDEEMFNGRPKVPGLRRLLYLVGDVIENTADCVQPPCVANGFTSTVKATLVINWTKGMAGDMYIQKVFTGLADVNDINTDKAFARFASSTCETRAEGRAIKKALNIQVTTAEEMTDVSADAYANGEITPTQRNFIDLKCRQNGINVLKFISSYKGQYPSIDKVPSSVAGTMIKHLSELQQDRSRIPERIKGYDPNWNDK